MKNYIGFIIRKKRLELNLSQESLCKGICVVSYLSKIEQGLVAPSNDILSNLFKALGITYKVEPLYLEKLENLLNQYFEKYFYEEETGEEYASIEKYAKELELSPYELTWKICRLYEDEKENTENLSSSIIKDLETRIIDIEQYKEYMDKEQLYLLYIFKGTHSFIPNSVRLESLEKAKQLKPCSTIEYSIQRYYFEVGLYLDSIRAGEKAYSLAAEEGNAYILLSSSFCLGTCYSNHNNAYEMLRYYNRTISLARNYKPEIIYDINYNIGATYVEQQKYSEAIPYLLQSLERGNQKDLLLTYHKLAIIYIELHNKVLGKEYLEKAKELITDQTPIIYAKMIQLVELKLEVDYLNSLEYEEILVDIYKTVSQLGFGFQRFHGNFLIELYINQRKYKEALNITREINGFNL